MKRILIIGLMLIAVLLYRQSKATTNRNVFSFSYTEFNDEFNDGCLVLSGNRHYEYWIGSERGATHRNDNAVVRSEINHFNNEIRRLDAVTEDNQQAVFNQTPIGSWYFIYRVNQWYDHRNYPGGRDYGIPLTETCVTYNLNMWRVDVVRGR